jgi:hypothetical protein
MPAISDRIEILKLEFFFRKKRAFLIYLAWIYKVNSSDIARLEPFQE